MINHVTLIGRVGKDPEVRYLQDGTAVATTSLATTEKWKDKNGERQEKTTWHRLVFWAQLAEIVAQYVTKGALIYVDGKIEVREYEKDGQKRSVTEIRCATMKMLGDKGSGNGEQREQREQRPAPAQRQGRAAPARDDFDDDIPF